MTLDELRAWRDAKPFVPFVIRMTTGEAFTVSSPEHIAIPPVRGDAVFVSDDQGGPVRLGVSSIADVRRKPQRGRKAG